MRTTQPQQGNDNEAPLPTSCCPVCRYEMNDAKCVGGPDRASPRPGDISICLNCGEVLQFNDILVIKPMPTERLATLRLEMQQQIELVSHKIKERGRFTNTTTV